MTFEYKNLLLLKSPQDNVTSDFQSLKENKASQTYHICQGHYEIKSLFDFTDEPLVQCNVLAVKNTLLDDDDNYDRK